MRIERILGALLVLFLGGMGYLYLTSRPEPADLAGWRTDTSRRIIELDEMVRGCPRRDCIPSIDEPRFATVAEGDGLLDPRAPVMVLVGEKESRAYPLQILARHEIVNDEMDGRPVAVTYCPLWNTALAFVRTLDGEPVELGVSGFLRHRNLVMYDRRTETLWSQMAGEAVVGERVGERLEPLPSLVLSWTDFKALAPDGRVLVGVEKEGRDYGLMHYAGYDPAPGPLGRLVGGGLDGLRSMDHVLALDVQGPGVAVPLDVLESRRVVHTEVAGEPVVVLWAPGTASVLDAATVAESRDVGAAAAFSATLDGRPLTFRPADGGRFTDAETGSTWTVAGTALEGPLAGRRLTPVIFTDAFWFGWKAFRPRTRVLLSP